MMTEILLLVAALVILFFVIRGAFRGFSGELAPLLGIAAAVGVLWIGHGTISGIAGRVFTDSPTLAAVIASAAVGIILYFLTAKLFRRVFGLILPQPFNALLGMTVGLLKSLILISVICGTYRVAAEQFSSLRNAPMDQPILKNLSELWADRFRENPDILREAALRAIGGDPDASAAKP